MIDTLKSDLPMPDERATLTVEEAARCLGISRGLAYAGIHAGEIPVIRIGRRLLVPTSALRQMVGLTG